MKPHTPRPPVAVGPLLVALPPLVLAAVGLLVLAAGALGRDGQWRDTPLSVPEAIAVHDWGQAIRRIEQGDDPVRAHMVPGANSSEAARLMTPLEAAVRENDVTIVATLIRDGAVADGAERLWLSCLALSRDAPAIGEFLLGEVPGAAACATVDLTIEADRR